jgi:photosystem II stability/assembly factor-like uncharacterized protein
MHKNKKQNETKAAEQTEKQVLYGNVIVVTVGCKQCPVNEEYRTFSREESDEAAKKVGQVFECANCHGQWLLKRVQIRGVILEAEQDEEEWRVAPLFVPILSSFDINTLNILDAPVSMMEDKEDGQ